MITSLYAALLAFLYLFLTVYVIRGRWKYQIGLGDGGNPAMLQRIRMHGNFQEFVPLALILLLLVDFARFPEIIVHALGLMLLVGRIAHAFGIYTSPITSAGRAVGVVLTVLMIAIAAGLLLYRYILVNVVLPL